ncbi:MAG: hypothetical protein Barrevirus9_15 [Barrevirus sp.]|uniref:Uncharacterized protein n=1 Tax=Barrevirus sp. TaxID=2487763 RepID=A0A3G4ZQ75_9VIRU|nr:MAG: hypothetical protein Barrevirus9_15 [Barrevirus sp.]
MRKSLSVLGKSPKVKPFDKSLKAKQKCSSREVRTPKNRENKELGYRSHLQSICNAKEELSATLNKAQRVKPEYSMKARTMENRENKELAHLSYLQSRCDAKKEYYDVCRKKEMKVKKEQIINPDLTWEQVTFDLFDPKSSSHNIFAEEAGEVEGEMKWGDYLVLENNYLSRKKN